MEWKKLQKKYPEFIYEKYEWNIAAGSLAAVFWFKMGGIEFNPKIIIRAINENQIKKIGKPATDNFIFHLGLAEIPSYWKTACSPAIIIKAGYLEKNQIKFWQNLFLNGMGQFFYENRLPFIVPNWKICEQKPKKHPDPSVLKFENQTLVPLGGGKDSLVALELLRQAGKKTILFAFNPNKSLKEICRAAKGPVIAVERGIDPQLPLMAKKGFLNGHTPFSALLAFHSIASAAIFDCKEIAFSQEKSSNESNVKYLGRNINHQYSKSFDFENKFREYSKKYLAKNIVYFSFLRPLHEIQIAAIFSRHQKYFPYFLSCNKPFTLISRAAGDLGWCGNCPKCLSLFAMLYPFIKEERLLAIFKKNLFENEKLAPLMADLLGEGVAKPFECVGTFTETQAAFYLSLKKIIQERGAGDLPVLLKKFKNEYLPKYNNIDKQSKKILNSWDNRHNLAKNLVAVLKKAAVDNSI